MTPRALMTKAVRAGHRMTALAFVDEPLYASRFPRQSKRIDTYGATCLFLGCHATLTVRTDGVVLDASAVEPCPATQAGSPTRTAI